MGNQFSRKRAARRALTTGGRATPASYQPPKSSASSNDNDPSASGSDFTLSDPRKYHDTACVVLPVRLTVFLNSFFTIVFGCLLLSSRHSLHLYWLQGGYTHASATALGIENFLAIVTGIFGLYGTWTNNANWHQFFAFHNLYRFATLIACVVLDFRIVASCERWIADIKAQVDLFGFSNVMFTISFEGRCGDEKRNYFTATYSLLAVYAYLFWVGVRYQRELRKRPKYMFDQPPELLGYYAVGKDGVPGVKRMVGRE